MLLSIEGLQSRGGYLTLGTLVASVAIGSRCTRCTRGTRSSWNTVDALGSLVAVRASGTLGTLLTVKTVQAIVACVALCALRPDGALESLGSSVAGRARSAVKTTITCSKQCVRQGEF